MSPTRRVLVAAKHLALDKTSEGLCTARLVRALVDAGHEVRCLTTEPLSDSPLAGTGVEVVAVPVTTGPWRAALADAADPSRAAIPAGRRLRSVVRLTVTVTTGAEPRSWNEIAAWRHSLRHHCLEFAPDLVIVRGGGLGFEPHLAMTHVRLACPWIAHYHDPYPLSAYPPSYAHHTPLLSARQEQQNRRILRRASLVTFPSSQLADWTERASGVVLGRRRGVLANIGGPINDDEADAALLDRLSGDRRFLLVHTGTLLGPRSPLPLLRAFRRLLADGEDQASQSRLVLLGSIDRTHRRDVRFLALREELESSGNLRVEDVRTNHATAFGLTRRATATILLEADDPESPFFPGKLADYLVADHPILALSPPRSVARDLLGASHPLWCAPTDEDAILAALRVIWAAWREGRLAELRAPSSARGSVSAAHAVGTVDELVERTLAPPTDNRWSPRGPTDHPRGTSGGDRPVGSPP